MTHTKTQLNQKASTGLILCDVEKAFDRVWHDALLYKMIKLSFPIYLTRMIKSFLCNRSFRVRINNFLSTTRKFNYGVPQGAVNSPRSPITSMALFADDTALFVSSPKSRFIKSNLKKHATTIDNYFNKWKINLNHHKTQALFFTRRRTLELPGRNINVFNNQIQWETNVKYLGLYLDKKLTFNKHIEYVIQKAQMGIRILYPLLNRKSELNIKNKLLLYKVAIRPIFTYGCPAFRHIAMTHIKKLQILQNKTLKLILDKPWFENMVKEYIDSLIKRFDEREATTT